MIHSRDTLDIVGTSSEHYVYADASHIPFGHTYTLMRYHISSSALADNPYVINLFGRSLGSSVAMELQKQFSIVAITQPPPGETPC